MTTQTKALYRGIEYTLHEEIRMERDYLVGYDLAHTGIGHLVDLPNPQVSRLIRICYRNGGRLSRRKRP